MDNYFPPVKLVQMVDGECQAEKVDQDPKKVQHIVAVRTLITVIKVIISIAVILTCTRGQEGS